MKIDQFQDFIESDLAWRKMEISQLLRIFSATPDSTEVVGKSIILLLYAHWEGFIKKSSKLYLKYVSERKIKLEDLTLNFQAIVLKSHAAACMSENSMTLSREIAFINKQNKMLTKKFKVSVNVDDEFDTTFVNTEHNLSSKVLKNIIDVVGVKYNDAIRTRSHYLDTNLLKQRNEIGHGSKLQHGENETSVLELSEVVKLKDFVFVMLDYYSEILITYVSEEFFLRSKETERNQYEDQQETELARKLNAIELRNSTA